MTGAHYSVHDAFKVLHPSPAIPFPVNGIWVPRVPTKVSFFSWEATWGKVLTLD